MALTDQELQRAKELKAQGYSQSDIESYIGAARLGLSSSVQTEQRKRIEQQNTTRANNFTWRDVVAAPAKYLAPDAVDVFSDAIARRSSEAGKEYIDEPTARQYAGALLQTAGLAADVGITVGSFGAATPMTLGRNVALGAGLGYVYDVGEDLVQQEAMKDVLTPGFGTAVGGAAPLAFSVLGAGVRALRGTADDAGRSVAPVVRDIAQQTGEQVTGAPATKEITKKVTAGVEEGTRALGNRFTRAGRHLNDTLYSNAERNALRQNARPAVARAIDDGIDTNTITRIESADKATKDAYKSVVNVAEGADPKNAERVSGEYATQMYKIARGQQKDIGEQLGNARRALGNDILDETIYNPAIRTLRQTLKDNGINLKTDGSVEFNTSKYIDEEQKVISDIWARAGKFETITPTEIDEFMQYLSKLEYKTNAVDRIGNAYVTVADPATGENVQTNLFRYLRNTYDGLLEQVDQTGEIARLRREYSTVKSVTGEIEGSWLNGIDVNKSTDDELADAMSLALRRIDSRAKSRTTYGQMYRALDKYSRAFGYKGPDASDVSEFYLSTVEPLYTKTTPEASFGGPFASIRGAIEQVVDFGKANTLDKQKALKGLLDIDRQVKTPVSNAAPVKNTLTEDSVLEKKGVKDTIVEALRDTKGSLNPKRIELKRQDVSSDKYNRIKGIALDSMEEYVDMQRVGVGTVESGDVNRIINNKNIIVKALDIEDKSPKEIENIFFKILEDKGRKPIGLYDEADFAGKTFNQSATTKTIDALEKD